MAEDNDKKTPDEAQDIPNPAGTYSANPSARVRQTARSASKIAEKARRQARREVEEELETLRAQLDTYAERADEATREAVETARRRAREAYRDLRESAADSYDDLRERAEHGMEEAGEWAREYYEEARDRAHDYYDEAVDAGRRGYRRSRAYARQHPLAVGALGLAAGLVLGALLPRRDPPHPSRWYEPEHYGYERDPRRGRRRW